VWQAELQERKTATGSEMVLKKGHLGAFVPVIARATALAQAHDSLRRAGEATVEGLGPEQMTTF
jgi:hypothetical protein